MRRTSPREEEFLGSLPFGREEERLHLVPPHVVVKDAAERVVFYPKRSGPMLAAALARGMPKATDFRKLAWITTEARACAFLDKGRCVIHDLGGEPALPACKEFLCLTGYVFLVLDSLGSAPRERMATRSMEGLNGIALEALLLASDRLYGNERLGRLENEMAVALKAALEADERGDEGLVADLTGRCQDLEAGYRRAFSREKAAQSRSWQAFSLTGPQLKKLKRKADARSSPLSLSRACKLFSYAASFTPVGSFSKRTLRSRSIRIRSVRLMTPSM